jgi:hypothetical protein
MPTFFGDRRAEAGMGEAVGGMGASPVNQTEAFVNGIRGQKSEIRGQA